MAVLPAYAEVLFEGYSETFDPSVQRTEMERGPAKQSILNTHVEQKLNVSLLFRSADDVAAFEAWYFDTIKRIGWFTMTHPRTKQAITARFEGGSIGPLVPLTTQARIAKRDVVIEYLR